MYLLALHPETYSVIRAAKARVALDLDGRCPVVLDHRFEKGHAFRLTIDNYSCFSHSGHFSGDITFLRVE